MTWPTTNTMPTFERHFLEHNAYIDLDAHFGNDVQGAVNALVASADTHMLYISSLHDISETITIPFTTGKRIVGSGRNAGLQMTANNKPILKFTDDQTHSIDIHNMHLKYSTAQTGHTASIGIEWNSAVGVKQFHQFDLQNLWIVNAYDCLGTVGTPQLFASRFDGLKLDAVHSGVNFLGGTGNSLQFGHVYISGIGSPATFPAFRLGGRSATIRFLVIQNWVDTVFQVSGTDAETLVQQVHIEDCDLATASSALIQVVSGPLHIESLNVNGTQGSAINSSIAWARTGGFIKLDQVNADFPAPVGGSNLGLLSAATSDSGSRAELGWVETAVNVTVPGITTGGFSQTGLRGPAVNNSAAATTPGTVVKKMEVFDAKGTSLGFVPIYNTIT